MFSRRAFLSTFGLAAAGAATSLRGGIVPEAGVPPEVIGQQGIGSMACGPCSLANALTHGDAAGRRAFASVAGSTPLERVETIIQQFGDKPSEKYQGRQPRYSETDGTTTEDLPLLANDLLRSLKLAEVDGHWLNVREGENGRAHLRRLHGLFSDAMAAGFPAIVEVRSFGANTAAPKGPVWDGLLGHWMPVVGVEPAVLPARATGFVCRFADSVSGTVIDGYAHAELHRPFTATHGFTLNADGTKKWDWITGYPYILLQAPDLGLNTQTRLWHERTYFSMNYAVCRTAG